MAGCGTSGCGVECAGEGRMRLPGFHCWGGDGVSDGCMCRLGSARMYLTITLVASVGCREVDPVELWKRFNY